MFRTFRTMQRIFRTFREHEQCSRTAQVLTLGSFAWVRFGRYQLGAPAVMNTAAHLRGSANRFLPMSMAMLCCTFGFSSQRFSEPRAMVWLSSACSTSAGILIGGVLWWVQAPTIVRIIYRLPCQAAYQWQYSPKRLLTVRTYRAL